MTDQTERDLGIERTTFAPINTMAPPPQGPPPPPPPHPRTSG